MITVLIVINIDMIIDNISDSSERFTYAPLSVAYCVAR
jgi:hypothetical protein